MSVGAILSRTANYFFRKLNFDYPYWHTYEHANWDDLDAALAAVTASIGIKGAWTNSIAVVAGERYIDTTTGNPYVVLVNHTTAASGTFADERTAHPTYWAIDAISDNSITLAKIQDIPTATLLGRFTAGSGDPEQVSMLTARQNLGILPKGQCRLNYISTSSIRLDPFDGNLLQIGDVPCKVPSGGVSLSPSGLTANTDYYVFAADANGDGIVDTLETALVSAGLATDATTGIKTKATDRTRTLVGLVRPVAGPNWENTKPFVRSYYNRQRTYASTISTTDRTFPNTGAGALIHATLRAEFIAFADDGMVGYISYPTRNSGANETYLLPVVDATIPSPADYGVMVGTNVQTVNKVYPFSVATNGYHYLDVYGSVAAGTGTVGKAASQLYGRTMVAIG